MIIRAELGDDTCSALGITAKAMPGRQNKKEKLLRLAARISSDIQATKTPNATDGTRLIT